MAERRGPKRIEEMQDPELLRLLVRLLRRRLATLEHELAQRDRLLAQLGDAVLIPE